MSKQRFSYTKEFLRRIAITGWNKSPYFTYSSKYSVLRRWLIAKFSARQKMVLSIGCGSGELESELNQQGRKVVGLDICFEMLQTAGRRGLRNLVQGDARYLPFKSSVFDVVLFPESIGYFELGPVLAEVARVLKARGRILITAYPTDFASDSIYKKRSLQEIARELNEGGFRVIEQSPLTVSNKSVKPVVSEEYSGLLYVLAEKKANK